MALKKSDIDEKEHSGLRLVPDSENEAVEAVFRKQFVNHIFFRIIPKWRLVSDVDKARYKAEFISVFEEFTDDLLLFSYSLVGFDSKADLMFWRVGESLDLIQDMTAKLYRTRLGSYFEPVDNYLSVTGNKIFVAPGNVVLNGDSARVVAGDKKYCFVYPIVKSSDWYAISVKEREEMITENLMVGMKFENIKIHMTFAFGFSDKEYLVIFETDEPMDFLMLAEELRQTPASKMTLRGLPVFTCRLRPLSECLDALG
ncbi:MAG: chlorite dismutase family protein [Pyrinomonadaceae bacterium]